MTTEPISEAALERMLTDGWTPWQVRELIAAYKELRKQARALVETARKREREAVLKQVCELLSQDSKFITPAMGVRAMLVIKKHFKEQAHA